MAQLNYCIVVGSQRSGTTLTAQILGAHPHSIVIDEEDGLYAWTSALINGDEKADELLLAAIHNAQNKYVEPERRFGVSGVLSKVNTLVLKAPNLTYSWSELGGVMLGARIVYVYRGVKAIVASMKKLQSVRIVENQTRYMLGNEIITQRFPSEIKLLCSESEPICKKMPLVALIKMSFITDFRKAGFDVKMLQYERLVAAPEQAVMRLLKHVGLDCEDQCVHYSRQYQGVGPGFTVRTRKVDENSIYTWRHALSDEEKYSVDEIVGDFLDRHGHLFEVNGIEYM